MWLNFYFHLIVLLYTIKNFFCFMSLGLIFIRVFVRLIYSLQLFLCHFNKKKLTLQKQYKINVWYSYQSTQ